MIKQINNLKIKYNRIYDKYQIISPDKKVLEEFKLLINAIIYAKNTKDFIKRK